MDAVNLSFRYSEGDYVRAMRAHYRSKLRLRLDIVLAVILAALGAYLWRFTDSRSYGIVLMCLSAVFAAILIAAFAVIPYVAFRGEPKFRDEYSLTFSPQGIHFRTAHIDSELQWSMYSRALVDAHSFLLYHGVRSFTVIPKRVFQSIEQQRQFEQLLFQKVPNIVRKNC